MTSWPGFAGWLGGGVLGQRGVAEAQKGVAEGVAPGELGGFEGEVCLCVLGYFLLRRDEQRVARDEGEDGAEVHFGVGAASRQG